MEKEIKKRKSQLTPVQKKLLQRAQDKGLTINLEHREGETVITLSDGSTIINPTFRSLLKKGALLAVGDGLFEESQSFRFA